MTVVKAGAGDNRFALLWQRAVFDSDLPKTTKLVLAGLVTFMDADGSNCYPSIQGLADRCSLTKTGTLPHLELAQAHGFLLTIVADDSRGKGWRRHSYRPLIPNVVVNGVDHVPSDGGQPPSHGGQPGVTMVVNGVDPTYPIITYPIHLPPLSPKGEEEEKSDFDFGKKQPAFKIYPGDPAFDRWCSHYRASGNEDRATEAVVRAYVAETSKFPPPAGGAGQKSDREASA